VVEGQNLGVEVADGHIIKCSITGKICLQMTDDNGDVLNAVLHDIMYNPGLSHRLFSITLYFGEQQLPVTLSNDGSRPMAADVTVVSSETEPHAVPSKRYHDHSAKEQITGLELLHQRLGHRKCRALLAASKHGV
jgi:hypothetical protein